MSDDELIQNGIRAMIGTVDAPSEGQVNTLRGHKKVIVKNDEKCLMRKVRPISNRWKLDSTRLRSLLRMTEHTFPFFKPG